MAASDTNHTPDETHVPTSFSIRGMLIVTAFFSVVFLVISLATRDLQPQAQAAVFVAALVCAMFAGIYVAIALLWRNRIARQIGKRLLVVNDPASDPHGVSGFVSFVVYYALATLFALPLAMSLPTVQLDGVICFGGFMLLVSFGSSFIAGFHLMRIVIKAPDLEFYERAIVAVNGYGKLTPLSGILWRRIKSFQLTASLGDGYGHLFLDIRGGTEPIQLKILDPYVEPARAILKERVPHLSQTLPNAEGS